MSLSGGGSCAAARNGGGGGRHGRHNHDDHLKISSSKIDVEAHDQRRHRANGGGPAIASRFYGGGDHRR